MKIKVKVYEEIKYPFHDLRDFGGILNDQLEWVDKNGINTPYVVTYV